MDRKMKREPILCFRPFKWFFRKDWYGTRVAEYPSGGTMKVLDVGAITIGYSVLKGDRNE